MPIVKWEPFGEFDRFFDDFPQRAMRNVGRDMAVDLYEEGDALIAEMNISGVDPEKIEVSVENDYLRIAGAREEEVEKTEKQFYTKEICRGSFERTIHIPESVNDELVEAEYKDGILKIRMPKREEKKREKVKIVVKK